MLISYFYFKDNFNFHGYTNDLFLKLLLSTQVHIAQYMDTMKRSNGMVNPTYERTWKH